ncbi:MAG TPA: trehalose-phosphatase [Elusimicrobiota bacterium]|nr:trehalose-phosphatase [Elusimicrobiota bacterium]
MKPARWTDRLADEIGRHPRVLVVLDYDGTLVRLRSRPHLAVLGAEERAILRRLDRGRSRLAMMSGRAVADLRERVDVEDILYGGVFGLEIAGPGWHFIHPDARAMHQSLLDLKEALSALFADVPGAAIEDKGVGITVHYRNIPPGRREEFERRIAHARSAAPRGLSWRRGRMAWEILPRTQWDKGEAAKLLWKRLKRPFMLVIGDEHYDEPMLRAASGRGVGVRVGRGASEAAHRLRDAAAVRRLLRRVAEKLAGPASGPAGARFARGLKRTRSARSRARKAAGRPVVTARRRPGDPGSGRSARRPGRSGAAARG